jgi:hypothetical protein
MYETRPARTYVLAIEALHILIASEYVPVRLGFEIDPTGRPAQSPNKTVRHMQETSYFTC